MKSMPAKVRNACLNFEVDNFDQKCFMVLLIDLRADRHIGDYFFHNNNGQFGRI